ncbi:MAG: glycosyltransferase family 4 protein [Candidatus Eisenbacteria bacterium]|uniref:Glycosyltransferase family 4 protein n=1 Tax=Eiseniibacteriota bacterium TaxID=2212470 RepID=A0A538TZ58_UNCEI|nr:MAG: glycosyltransferase family 4 protein [Candidatus Eisenbacteria bacterium]
MKVAYVCADFGVPLDGSKGASVHVLEMVRALAGLGNEVVILTPAAVPGLPQEPAAKAGEPAAGDLLAPGVRCFTIRPDPDHAVLLEAVRRAEAVAGRETRLRQELRNLLYNVALLDTGCRVLGRHQIEFVYERYTLFAMAGRELARRLGVPHLLEVNAPLVGEQERTRGLELRALARDTERGILAGSDAVLVVSEPLVAFARSCGVPDSRVHLIPNAVDPERFDPARRRPLPDALRARLSGRRVIGFVGSLKPWHGLEILLQAFQSLHARITETHLLVVGDGPGRPALEDQARRLGLGEAVTLVGAVPHDQVPDHIAAMDVAVAPGDDDPGFYFSPIKIFEYMAMGKPVVAGAVPQLACLRADAEAAVLVEPGRADRLAEALERLVRDPGACGRIGAAARAWVMRERTWAGNARRVVEIAAALRGEAARAAEVQ